MPTKSERQAGWITAGIGGLTAIAGFALDEPALIGAGIGAVVGGATVGVGFEPEQGAAVGAGAGILAGAGAAAAGIGEPAQPTPTQPTTNVPKTPTTTTTTAKRDGMGLLLPAAVVGGLVLLS